MSTYIPHCDEPRYWPSTHAETDQEHSNVTDIVPPILDLRPRSRQVDRPHAQGRREQARLRSAAWAFTTRRVPIATAVTVLPPIGKPTSGDLVLARVDAIGFHSGLQLGNGRRRTLFVGDEIVVAYGNRYASTQFKSFVPESLGPCHLVAGGGIASRAVAWHDRIAKGPTHITPLGLLADSSGKRINLCDFRLPPAERQGDHQPTTIAIVGTAMDAGKTQTAAFLTKGLIASGLRVGYAKVTGTGAGGDVWLLRDAGADPVLDFTDAGLATTYCAPPDEVVRVLTTLMAHIARARVDVIVLEIADGVYQPETSMLLRSPEFAQAIGGIILAASDSMSANAGCRWLSQLSTPVLALSGMLTASPLQVEEASEVTSLPILNRQSLSIGSQAITLISQAQHHLESVVPRLRDSRASEVVRKS